MGRYELPDPKCQHAPKGRVTAGDLSNPNGPHASTYVCDRPACIDDAMEWARAQTHLEPQFVPRKFSVTRPDLRLLAGGSAGAGRREGGPIPARKDGAPSSPTPPAPAVTLGDAIAACYGGDAAQRAIDEADEYATTHPEAP